MRSRSRRMSSGLTVLVAVLLAACVTTTPGPQVPASQPPAASPTGSSIAAAATPAPTATPVPSEPAGWQLLPISALDGPASLNAVTTFHGALVAVGSTVEDTPRGAIWCSADGLTWRSCPGTPSLEGLSLASLAVGEPGLVVAGASDAAAVSITSADGVSWTRNDLPDASHRAVNGLAWHDGRFVAIGIDYDTEASPTFVWTSTDGRSWTRAANLEGPGQAIAYGLVAVPDGFVAGGSFRGHAVIWTSRDGQAWTRSSLPGSPEGQPGRLQLVAGHLFLPMGQDLWTSNDARLWGRMTVPGFGNGVFGVGAIPGGFVAVGRSSEGDQPGVVAVADANLAQWTLQPADPAFDTALAHDLVVSPDGRHLVAVGNSVGGSSVLVHADPAGLAIP
jgi:hypothetical protein